MTEYETLSLVLGILSVVLIPLGWVVIRGLVKWVRVENKLDNVISRMEELVKDKDVVHREIVNQMREDRKATNERLQWLERHAWGSGHA